MFEGLQHTVLIQFVRYRTVPVANIEPHLWRPFPGHGSSWLLLAFCLTWTARRSPRERGLSSTQVLLTRGA